MTRSSGWVVAQFVAAGALVVASVLVTLATLLAGKSSFLILYAWGVFPGAALSFLVNGLIMRHRGASHIPRVLLAIQFGMLAALVGSAFVADGLMLLGLIYGVPVYIVMAFVVLGFAVEAATTSAPSTPAADPTP